MTRLFIDEDLTEKRNVSITGDAAHYLLRVLRCQVGDTLVVVDTAGLECSARISECGADAVTAAIESRSQPATSPRVRLELYQAILKGKNFDLTIQKCTELGASRIIPVITQRTISRPDEGKLSGKVERWRKIALEACRQCRRTDVPDVAEPLTWQAAISDWRTKSIPGIVPYEVLAGDPGADLREYLRGLKPKTGLGAFVGPEGGFSPSEIDEGRDAGLHTVSLGPRILRAETAAIATCAIVMYELETTP